MTKRKIISIFEKVNSKKNGRLPQKSFDLEFKDREYYLTESMINEEWTY